jgi:hypothetical protein
MAKKDAHWMEHMNLKEGALTKSANSKHESVSKAIQQGLKSKNPTTEKRAVLARTFAKYRKGA